HRHDLRRIRIPVIFRQAVDLARDREAQDARRLLEREREIRHDRALRLVELADRRLLVADAAELVEKLLESPGRDFRPHVAAGAPRAGIFSGAEAAVDAVGVAFLLAEIEEKPRGSAAA